MFVILFTISDNKFYYFSISASDPDRCILFPDHTYTHIPIHSWVASGHRTRYLAVVCMSK